MYTVPRVGETGFAFWTGDVGSTSDDRFASVRRWIPPHPRMRFVVAHRRSGFVIRPHKPHDQSRPRGDLQPVVSAPQPDFAWRRGVECLKASPVRRAFLIQRPA